MNSATSPQDRERALARYNVMDTPAEPAFDDLVRLAGLICDSPTALMTLLDARRQWFKAKLGVDASETPIDHSFCRIAIQEGEATVVPDTSLDSRFSANPLVIGAPHIRFYAGAPMVTPEGVAIGTICVIDSKPRETLTAKQQVALTLLAQQAITHLELRRQISELQELVRQKSA